MFVLVKPANATEKNSGKNVECESKVCDDGQNAAFNIELYREFRHTIREDHQHNQHTKYMYPASSQWLRAIDHNNKKW